MAIRDDVDTPAIAMIGVIGALLFFAAVVSIEVMYYRMESSRRYQNAIGQPPAELTALDQRERARLAEYRWVDEKKQIAAIPIEHAMELVVAESADKKSGAATATEHSP